MGTATAPGGHTLTLDSRSLLRDGQPWLLISGEFHYARCPESEWRDELLKMKAGGVSVVASYIFWIHHEEVEGTWDWTGQRNLRKFLETCQEVGSERAAADWPVVSWRSAKRRLPQLAAKEGRRQGV